MRSVMIIVGVILLGGVPEVLARQGNEAEKERLISKTIEKAEFDFYNALMYRKQEEWIGRTISFRGAVASRASITNAQREYEQIQGASNSGEVVDVIAFFDPPLTTPGGYGDEGPTVSRGIYVRVFGVLQKSREVLTWAGNVRILPTLEVLLIYAEDDRSFSFPLWVSKSLKR